MTVVTATKGLQADPDEQTDNSGNGEFDYPDSQGMLIGRLMHLVAASRTNRDSMTTQTANPNVSLSTAGNRMPGVDGAFQQLQSLVEAGLSDPSSAGTRTLANQGQEPTQIPSRSQSHDAVELSIVMPCLNEADTLATCIAKCQQVIQRQGYKAEIIVADNGSTDGSIQIAQSMGARVIHVAAKGYGNALKGGIDAARGDFVIMGDADDSYDFTELPKFVDQLRQGFQLVQGCRLPSGGGTVRPGAMPLSHRWIGNPMFTAMVQRMFGAPIHDVYCGMRGFQKQFVQRLDLQCCGMEYATEMIIKSSLFEASMTEVPITLHPDGRKAHAPHLRTLRDGWRTLRFFLVYSPRYLFLVPGLLLMILGLVAFALAMPATKLFGATLDAHTLLFGTLSILIGYQTVQFAIFSKTFAVQQGLMPPHRGLDRLIDWFSLERGLLYGALLTTLGIGLLVVAVDTWSLASFGRLDYAAMMRIVIPGMTAAAIGFQTIMSSFFLGVLKLAQRPVSR